MNQPFTEEQLNQIGYETERAAGKSLHRYVQQARIGFAILLVGVGFSLWDAGHKNTESRQAIVQSGRVVSVDGCNRDFHTITKLRNLLIAAKHELKTSYEAHDIPGFTQRQYDQSIRFYNSQLAGIPLPDCREAEAVVTDDPNANTPIPTPLYPKRAK